MGLLLMVENGTNDQTLCDELGTIKVQIIPIEMLRRSDPDYHPCINKNLTYGIENINPLKIHGAKHFSLGISSNDIDISRNQLERDGHIGRVKELTRTDLLQRLSSSTEVLVSPLNAQN